LHKVSRKKLKEIKDFSKLNETDERGRKRYILSERTGKPVLNTANARYRNSKYLIAKNLVPNPETNKDSENERESIGAFIRNNYNKPRDIDSKYFKTISRELNAHTNYFEKGQDLSNRKNLFSLDVVSSVLQTELQNTSTGFKCNVSFSYVLRNKDTETRKIYYRRDNNTIFPSAIRIENRRDINALLSDLRENNPARFYGNS